MAIAQARAAAHGAQDLGGDRLAVLRGDEVHTCGRLLEIQRGQGRSTRACILPAKAVDAEEDCPDRWWPRDTVRRS